MSENQMDRETQMDTVIDLVKKARTAMLTTRTREGRMVSRPLAVQDVEFDGDLWFFSNDPSHKTEEIAADPQVNASMQSGGGFLSISGTAEVVHDRSRFDEYWSPMVEAWFPEGKDAPDLALLVVHGETAEFWEADKPKLVMAFEIARAAVTRKGRPDVGKNETVDLRDGETGSSS